MIKITNKYIIPLIIVFILLITITNSSIIVLSNQNFKEENYSSNISDTILFNKNGILEYKFSSKNIIFFPKKKYFILINLY